MRTVVVLTVIGSLADPPADAHDAYLRLHLISNRLIAPHQANLDGIFGVLANVAWTTRGPVDPAALTEVRMRFRAAGEPFSVTSVDKFPRMADYVVPTGVRIADADRVRLGAHLADGHHGDARGLRELQRGHARHEHGRGPDLGGRRRRRRLRRRRRRVDHGHAQRRRHRGHLGR